MRLLIDGCGLSTPEEPESAFWGAVIPTLVSVLPGDDIYLLNRRPEAYPAGLPSERHLFGPAWDHRMSVAEDRRLAALCNELGIDVFLTTSYSTAGARVGSLFVAGDFLRQTIRQRPDLCETISRAARLATGICATSDEALHELCRVAGLPVKAGQVVENLTGAVLAARLAQLMQATVSEDVQQARLSEEQWLATESLRLRAADKAEAETRWEQQMHVTLPLIPRVIKAARNVQKYPEYLKRIFSR